MRASAACFLLAFAAAAQPDPRATCGKCHAAETATQPKTAMGIGIELPADQVALKSHPKLEFEKDGYHFQIERRDGISMYTVSGGAGSLSVPIRYGFGAHMQTFMLEYQGRLYESTVSYFPRLNGLGVTLGHEHREFRTPVDALGRELPHTEVVACFECHGTGGVQNGELKLEALRPGLDCEHCHAGATAHMSALSGGPAAPVPKRLGRMAAEDMSAFCGKCHRTWEDIIRLRQFGVANARFQPYRLANSKCFLGDDQRIRCTACHNPHDNLADSKTAYDRACLACHKVKSGDPAVAGAKQNACPVGTAGCPSCHMPQIRRTDTPAVFTDHQIRVVRPGDPYPN